MEQFRCSIFFTMLFELALTNFCEYYSEGGI